MWDIPWIQVVNTMPECLNKEKLNIRQQVKNASYKKIKIKNPKYPTQKEAPGR